jgi:hypothetical protein
MRETLNAYTVSIQLESRGFNKFDFEKSYLNKQDNKACNNEAIKQGIEFLKSLPEEQLIGILVVRQPMVKSFSGSKYIGSGVVHNTYSHICNDKSNWVTVKEAKAFLKAM